MTAALVHDVPATVWRPLQESLDRDAVAIALPGLGTARPADFSATKDAYTGEDCFFLKLRLRSITDLEPLLDRFTPYGRTTTSIIHSSPNDRRGPPLEQPR